MQSITKYSIPTNESTFTLSIPQLGLPNDYYLPVTYIGSLIVGNSDYYLFVRDEK